MIYTAPSLSRREVGLLAQWERTGVTRVTTRDVASLVGEAQAPHVLSRLARKRALDRIGRGIYMVRPLRAVGVPWANSAIEMAAHLLAGQPYYVGGAVALTLHRLTTQQYYSIVDAFVSRQRPAQVLGQATVVFHTLRWADAFALGISNVSGEPIPVLVSDPERTLLDLVDRPDLLGGSRSALAAVRDGLDRIDLDRLVAYALRWPRTTTRQRLGYLMEKHGAPPAVLCTLAAGTRPSAAVPVLLREPAAGAIHPTWRVRMNDQDEAPRRWKVAE